MFWLTSRFMSWLTRHTPAKSQISDEVARSYIRYNLQLTACFYKSVLSDYSTYIQYSIVMQQTHMVYTLADKHYLIPQEQ